MGSNFDIFATFIDVRVIQSEPCTLAEIPLPSLVCCSIYDEIASGALEDL